MKKTALMFLILISLSACAPREISIDVYHHLSGERRSVLARHLHEFTRNNTHVTINMLHKSWDEMEAIMRRSEREAGSEFGGIYLIAHDRIGQLAENRYIQEISGYLEAKEKLLHPNALEAVRYREKYFGFPVASECVALYYNRDIVSQPPASMEELISLKASLHNPDSGRYLLVMPLDIPYYVLPWVLASGGSIFDEQGLPRVDSPENPGAFTRTADLLFNKLEVHSSDTQTTVFKQGLTAFMIQGPWNIEELYNEGINFGVSEIPGIQPFIGVQSMVLSTRLTQEQAKAAYAMFDSLQKSGFSREFSTLTKSSSPFIADQQTQSIAEDPVVAGFARQAATGIPMNNTPYMALIWDAFSGENLNRIMKGRVNIQDFLSQLQKEILKQQE